MSKPFRGTVLDRAALKERIDALPRVRLTHLPTPLDFCPRLTEALGGPRIYVKRDDMTGLAFGGNNARQPDFLFANILDKGAHTVVAGADTQSNWCRQITAAGRRRCLPTPTTSWPSDGGATVAMTRPPAAAPVETNREARRSTRSSCRRASTTPPSVPTRPCGR